MKRVVLLGGGHAHLHVLRDAALRPWKSAEITLVSPFDHHHYSGMVPGYLQGQYGEDELRFDLRRLCRASGARFVRGYAQRIDASSGWVDVEGHRIPFDLASLDVGSAPAGTDVPGVQEHASTVRPMSRAVALRDRVDERIHSVPDANPVRVCVVGGGAGGVEVALALHRRIERAGKDAQVTVLDRGPILSGYSARARERATALLVRRGIVVQTGHDVVAVQTDAVVTEGGQPVGADLVVWLTGAAPPRLLDRSNLPTSPGGFFQVDSTLRSVDGTPVWGAGDCVTLSEHPDMPKAGVYAVREGPVLAHNLRAQVEGGPPREYRPQSSFLSLLNTADGKALLRWHGLLSHSRWAWWLKDWIDRRFVRSYHQVEQTTP